MSAGRRHEPTPLASSPLVRRVMQANRSRGTGPERRLRNALRRRGLRLAEQARPLPTSRVVADFLSRRERLAVFVDGCFWHGCPLHGRTPKAHRPYWRQKVQRNQARDLATTAALTQAGWTVLRLWEHVPAAEAAELVHGALRAARAEHQGRDRRSSDGQ